MPVPPTLAAHLESYLGAWPPPPKGLLVVGSDRRARPAWDGNIRPVAGVATTGGAIVSVAPDRVEAVRSLGPDLSDLRAGLADVLGLRGWRFSTGVFRWTVRPADTDDPGVWVPTDDPRVPAWLRPFNGEVLLGLDDGEVAAGVGRKIHDRWGHELAVVTEEKFRGRGWAYRLVAQAARRVLADGAVPTYLHPETNVASARTADAAGFPDLGWKIIGLFPGTPG